ncbi:DUF938 domain-containing protein [Psychrobacter sp. I-STPA10]|uniref:DUF938 domain-containing protein n=1 Tax=Psychrobacter sp. I-STPA10 TaxID=2585769 RepID=UPI001E48BF75|nr:DUF938 domain-containing protein [Psychrobacter sp. I-STPA10]
MKLSHQHNRAFQPNKLHPPRDFDEAVRSILTVNTHLPLIVEIGAGKGKHALQYAKNFPNNTLIAIERTSNKFQAFAKLAKQHNVPNLLPIHADAIAWIVYALAPKSVDAVYLLYPNPEPHNLNQQWLNMPFFEFLLSRLKDEGEVILATNIASYMDNAQQQAKQIWQLPSQCSQVATDSARTHFEVKYLARGEICWQLNMRKPTGYITRFDNWIYQK